MITNYYYFHGIPDKVFKHILKCQGDTIISLYIYTYNTNDKNPTWKKATARSTKSYYLKKYKPYKKISQEKAEAIMFLDLL